MTVEYSKVNYIRLAQPPHHGRGPSMPVVVEAEGYPKETKAFFIWYDKDGRAYKNPIYIMRGLDKRLVREYNPKYMGAELRKIRALKGVGRPWLTLLPQNAATS